MRLSYVPAPRWSQYEIGDAERDALADQIVALALRLGFALPPESIHVARLKENGDAILISLDGGRWSGSQGKHYVTYPMENRENATDPVVLKSMAVHGLFTFLHEQRWRQERRRATCGLVGGDLDRHLDGDTLIRWARALAAHDTSRVTGLETVAQKFHETAHSCQCSLKTRVGTVKIAESAITLPLAMPDTLMSGMRMKSLQDLMSLPSCGDELLDEELAKLYISEVEAVDASTARPRRTVVKLMFQRQRPLIAGEDSHWRRLREIRPVLAGIAPDFVTYDIEGGTRDYHAQCDRALGESTALPIALERTAVDDAP